MRPFVLHGLTSTIVLLFWISSLSAQETPTERRAARDVLRKMAELEESLDVPNLVRELTRPNPERDQVVARAKELMEKELLAMSDAITREPEIGFQEFRAVEQLTSYLKQHDFQVEIGVAGLETAFVARYRSETSGPNLGVILEYDALRGTERPFHGDQHSAQGPVGMAAAVAMAEYLTRSGNAGNVVVFGAPGEEMMPPNAKTDLFDAGVFDGMDLLVRSHAVDGTSRPAPGFGTCCLNIDGVKFVFSGAPAHQMASWNGRNALTAVIKLFNNIDSVRSNIRPEARIQGVITEGGAAPNVVPDRAVADFYIRYPDAVYLEQVREFTDSAARAAALATGTKVKIDHYGKTRDGISVATLAEVAFEYMKRYDAKDVLEEPGKPQGYEETGSVSSAIPGIGFTAKSSNAPNHTYEMEADALAEVGHQGFLVDAQSMAALLFDFATNAEYRAKVKHEFDTIKTLFQEYQQALRETYQVPKVPEPK
ncbi:MAG: peptidase dimerization domain-containing protein [Acidobacteriota bacterium]